jgi:hypothetical protein
MTKNRMVSVAMLQQEFPQFRHKALEIDPTGTKEGALVTDQTIPQALFILNVFRV